MSSVRPPQLPAAGPTSARSSAPWPKAFWIALGALSVLAALPLQRLFTFAYAHEFFSYIVLIPFVSAYFVWTERPTMAPAPGQERFLALIPAAVALGLLALAWSATPGSAPAQDSLALTTGAFVLLLVALCRWFLGWPTLSGLLFPLGFLVFLIPFPTGLHVGIETALQHASAAAAGWMFQLIGTPIYLEGTLMQLPGFSMEVAPECSGIRSSMVLLITSVIAGKLFLRNPWSRTVLVFLVIPVSIVRNAFRITVIGELCVNIGPHMIHSYIHRKGGPIFFALSLIPLFVGLWLLMRREKAVSGKLSNQQ